MRFALQARRDYLAADLVGRESAEEMRRFLHAVRARCRRLQLRKVLITIRQSRALFKAEDYGLPGYAHALASPECQVALVGDSPELNAAHEYIEVIARQDKLNVRAFADEAAAARWLGGGATMRSRLFDHFAGRLGAATQGATHYSWEVCADPAAREAELLREYEHEHGRLPRYNAASG